MFGASPWASFLTCVKK
ncbi:hypothetical protein [Streptomyces sp. NPDC013187]